MPESLQRDPTEPYKLAMGRVRFIESYANRALDDLKRILLLLDAEKTRLEWIVDEAKKAMALVEKG